MKLTLDRPNLISLAAGFTDNESLPVRETRELLDEILRASRTGRPALQYGTTLGDPLLRRLTAERVRALDGVKAGSAFHSPDRTIITAGSQQFLYMVTEALCDPGDIVLVEDPTYFVFLGIMQSHGLRARGLKMEQDGFDFAHLELTLDALKRSGQLPRVKMLYLVSYFQNPTGRSTSYEKKLAALELLRRYERAAGHPIYLLEDAAYRELHFQGATEKSALAVGHHAGRVIYAGTYSKPFATGARVGFGFLPEPVFTAVQRIKGNHDFGTTNLLQQLLARALASGRYERHLLALRQRYALKSRTTCHALREHFPAEVLWQEPQGGLYVWARTPAHVKTGLKSRFFQAALDQGVIYVPGGLCYAADSRRKTPDHEMRISFGGASLGDIRTGISLLGKALRRAL